MPEIKRGRPPIPEDERRVSVTVRLPREIADGIDEAAERLGVARTALVAAAFGDEKARDEVREAIRAMIRKGDKEDV